MDTSHAGSFHSPHLITYGGGFRWGIGNGGSGVDVETDISTGTGRLGKLYFEQHRIKREHGDSRSHGI